MANMMLEAAAWVSALTDAMAHRLKEERGQDLIEYAVLGGGIALVAAVAILATPLDGPVTTFISRVGGCISLNGATCNPPATP